MTPHQPLPPPSEQPPSHAYPGRLGAWLAFTRPKTWLLAVAPVLAALALAWAEAHAFSPVVANTDNCRPDAGNLKHGE